MNTKPVFSEQEVERWFEEEGIESAPPEGYHAPDPAEKYAQSQLRVIRETRDYQLDYIGQALQPGRELIEIAPTYQRRLRWTQKQRSLLIESFLLNIPVPPIFLFEHDYNEYEVIDGRQRLETISEFLANNFGLQSLEFWPELNRKRFNDLPTILQKALYRRTISAVVLLAETSAPDQDKLDVRRVLFDRLNTGGTKLNPQELRNALYPGPLNALLIRLARSDPFTTAWLIPKYVEGEERDFPEKLAKNTLFKTQADAELVLRFFALRDAIENNRKGSLRRILDRFMAHNADADEGTIYEFEQEFIFLLDQLVNLFGGRPFRLPTKANRPSRPLYDALMIALSQAPQTDLEADSSGIKLRLEKALRDDASYDVLVGRGNTIEAIHDRVELARRILSGADS